MIVQPQNCDLLTYLVTTIDMTIKIEYDELSDTEYSDNEDLKTNEELSLIDDTSHKSILHTHNNTSKNDVLNETNLVISECNEEGETPNCENLTLDIISFDNCIRSSTPHNETKEDNFFNGYKPLSIPQETKYIELKLCCNRNPITSYAQLAENNDSIFSDVSICEFTFMIKHL